MNYIQKILFRRDLRRVFNLTFESDLRVTLLELIKLFRRMDDQLLLKVWRFDYSERQLYGKSLNDLLNQTDTPIATLKHPLEWLTGTTRSKMVDVLTSPANDPIRDLMKSLWYTNVGLSTDHLESRPTEYSLDCIRAICRGVRACL